MRNSLWAGSTGERYGALDGLRGVAAIAVALLHYDRSLVPAGYLAVDLFFLLSGFILTRTYGPQLADGLGAGRLILKRMVRLYPLHVTGVVLFTLSVLQGLARGRPGRMPLDDLAHSFPFNVLMLPSPYSALLFPLNFPAWSLSFELLASCLFAAGWSRLPRPTLLAGSVVFAVMLIAATHNSPIDPDLVKRSALGDGSRWSQVPIALLRCGFAFNSGVLIGLIPAAAQTRRTDWRAGLCLIGVGALCATPIPPSFRLGPDLATVLLLWPAMVWFCSRVELPPAMALFGARSGELSYALYVVHAPLVAYVRGAAVRLGLPEVALAPVYLAVALGLAALCTRWIDGPVRRALTRRFLAAPRPG
ncbi:acyltransferase [Novosphingobium sp.]|uniref:acyltransferase family protein n=1 Tax=Novosphingobium sp. TaxID=1874826 RepID=UPI001D8BE03F|nr:acyltransferase [Novosphingobium sp.]MBX9665435.1 acyltransferase [Novosphingobium sp.]